MALRSWAGTHVGRVRPHNDNAFFHSSRRGVFLVANGVGGDRRGGAASALLLQLAQPWADRFHELQRAPGGPPSRAALLAALGRLFQEASQAIYEAGLEDPELAGMCTTAVMAALQGTGVAIAHVGQNRAYHVRDGRARQLTSDHTVAQGLVDRGVLLPGEVASSRYRNVLTRTIGHLPTVEVETVWFDALPGDALVIGSKGLIDHLGADDIGRLVEEGAATFVERAIALGNERGGRDNLTAVLVEIGAPEERPAASEPGADLGDTAGLEPAAAAAGAPPRAAATASAASAASAASDTAPLAATGAPSAPPPEVPAPRAYVDTEARLAALRALPLFEHLGEQELLRVLRVVEDRRFAPGDTVVREGTPGEELYIVVEGTLLVENEGVELTTLARGRHFGDVSFVEGAPRSATVKALTPVTLLELRRQDFLRSIAPDDPRLATKLIWGFCQHLSRRLRQLTRDFVEVSRASAGTAAGAKPAQPRGEEGPAAAAAPAAPPARAR